MRRHSSPRVRWAALSRARLRRGRHPQANSPVCPACSSGSTSSSPAASAGRRGVPRQRSSAQGTPPSPHPEKRSHPGRSPAVPQAPPGTPATESEQCASKFNLLRFFVP